MNKIVMEKDLYNFFKERGYRSRSAGGDKLEVQNQKSESSSLPSIDNKI